MKSKAVIGAVSFSLLTSLIFSSSVNANNFNQQSNHFSTNRENLESTKSFSSLLAQTEVTYKQNIDTYSIHEYFFSTSGGQFTVSELHSTKDDIIFTIIDADTEEVVEYGDSLTFTLPAGDYLFEVQGFSEQPNGYEYKLSGSFNGQPVNQLPSLTVTKPGTHNVRLAKGSTRLDIAGTTNAEALDFYLNYNEPISLSSSFNKSLTMQPGYNTMAFNALDTDSLNAVWSVYDVVAPGIKRIGGKDRYEVSTGVSKELDARAAYSGTVIIARGDLYTDALSGGPLAAFEGAPVLLTKTSSLPASTIAELDRLNPDKVIILGGTGSVSSGVESQLRSMGIQNVQRIGGKDRFAVSAGVAEEIAEFSDTAIVASGLNFPDALSASGMAGYMGMPILLVGTNSVPDSIQTFIKNHPDIKNFIIVGGPATVSDGVKTKLSQLRSGAVVERIGGLNRYQVSINIANYGIDNYGMDLSSLVIARGDVFADALSGGPLAAYTGAPILLTTSSKLEGNVSKYLTENQGSTDFMYILGGTGSITTTTETQLSSFIK
ncbi:cell wall-binding repeat-containing protein [Fictibacillus halophilus]|uniref:cell wall-binding repeat-containing protein n=1 Tax=Fictibacillus halophilus TaxID=1610490 RepID=UPI001CFC19A5|nr:cell wall-binding repeat-containing protein [Fictibacillus halophilus]